MKKERNLCRAGCVRTLSGCCLLLLFALAGQTALGILPVEKDTEDRLIRLDAGRSFSLDEAARHSTKADRVRDEASSEIETSALQEFTERYGEDWKVQWDERTGTVRRVTGSHVATGLDSDSPKEQVESWTRGFVEENRALFGVGAKDLELLDLRQAGGRTYVTFRQTLGGLPVYGSHLKMNLNRKGQLVRIASNCYRDVAVDHVARLDPSEAARLAAKRIVTKNTPGKKGATPQAAPRYALNETQQVIFPIPMGRGDPFRLCYQLKIFLKEPLGEWVVVVDASTGVEYVRYNNFRFGTVSGKITGDILPEYYNEAPVSVNFENEAIHVFNSTPVYR